VQYANWLTVAFMADGEGQSGGLMGLVPLLFIFALFYFILIAPMRKKQKALQRMISELKNGDKIITNGGIYGTVTGVTEQVIQLRVADQVKIEISKSAVAGMQAEPGETKN
jgi:preprotein translocase subunit YajC